jgi:predicted PurR-regulated permease PerM
MTSEVGMRTLQAVHSSRSTTFLVVFALYGVVSGVWSGRWVRTHLVEHGLGLTTVTALLAVITTLSLGEQRGLAGLVLCDLVLGVCACSVFATPGGEEDARFLQSLPLQ